MTGDPNLIRSVAGWRRFQFGCGFNRIEIGGICKALEGYNSTATHFAIPV